MVKKYIKLLCLVLVLSILLSFSVTASENDCLYYFYGEADGCPDCSQTSNYLDKLVKKYPDLELHRFNVYTNLNNFDLLQSYFTTYNVPDQSQGIPAIFISESYLIGNKAIEELLESRIIDNSNEQCPDLVSMGAIGIVGEKYPHNVIETLTLLRITRTAFYNGFTFCALAVMLVLLFLLLLADERKKMLKIGSAFVLGVFLVYFLRGIGLPVFAETGFVISKIVGLLGILLGIVVMASFLKSEKSLLFVSWQKEIKTFLRAPWVFLAGLVFSFFSLSCFNGKYILLSNLITKPLTQKKALFLIVYYDLLVILPLLVLFLFVYTLFNRMETGAVKRCKYLDKQEIWRKHGLRTFRFVLGLFMLALGILLLAV